MSEQLNIKQAAELAGLNTRTLRRYIQTGRLAAELIKGSRGDEYRIERQAVEQLAEQPKIDRRPKTPDVEQTGLKDDIQALRELFEQQLDERLKEQAATIDRLRLDVERKDEQISRLLGTNESQAAQLATQAKQLEEREAEVRKSREQFNALVFDQKALEQRTESRGLFGWLKRSK